MWQSMIFEVLHASLMPLHISTRAVLLEEVLAEISIPSHPRIAFEHLSLYIQKDLGNNGQQSAVLLASLMPYLHHRKRQFFNNRSAPDQMGPTIIIYSGVAPFLHG